MKIKLSKYLARLLAENGITQVFSVTGGGAMHLNDGFGHEPGLRTLYMHHEQACAIAAESYARIYNKPACLCVTTGPGGTNAITGVVGAWLDSIPMIVISGQVRFDNTARWSGVGIRSMGDQEYDILRSVDCMTKYSNLVLDPKSIRREVEKCIWLSQTGRPGPCWLDIPVDIQGTYIDDEELEPFDVSAYEKEREEELARIREEDAALKAAGLAQGAAQAKSGEEKDPYFSSSMEDRRIALEFRKQRWQPAHERITAESPVVDLIIDRVKNAERPIFYTGNGIRIAGCEDLFLRVADRLGMPVVVGWNGIDVIPFGHPLYTGQPGGRGDRIGNFAVQNSDFILSVGSRLNIRQVGYNHKTWARGAFTVVCDIDAEELKKPSVHVDVPVHADAYELLAALDQRLSELGYEGHGDAYGDSAALAKAGYGKGRSTVFTGGSWKDGLDWYGICARWKERYPVYQASFGQRGPGEPVNMYEFYYRLSLMLPEDTVTVVGNGAADVACGQVFCVKDGSRFISQDAIASMGYDLPAAAGACAACHDVSGFTVTPETIVTGEQQIERDRKFVRRELETAKRCAFWKGSGERYPAYEEKDVICITGDGSIMMNLQELQTIASHHMPLKIFLVNNDGYQSIRLTQKNLFAGEPLVGIGGDSRDLSFPDFRKVAEAFGLPYFRAEHNGELGGALRQTLAVSGPALCEIFTDTEQGFEPKSAVKKHPDGSLSSPPLEDLAPFLSPEEMGENMIIQQIKD